MLGGRGKTGRSQRTVLREDQHGHDPYATLPLLICMMFPPSGKQEKRKTLDDHITRCSPHFPYIYLDFRCGRRVWARDLSAPEPALPLHDHEIRIAVSLRLSRL
jgi:hypothetical protein